MNRQARIKGDRDWISYGAITHVGAAKRHAACLVEKGYDVIVVETRDEDCPHMIYGTLVSVRTELDAVPLRDYVPDTVEGWGSEWLRRFAKDNRRASS